MENIKKWSNAFILIGCILIIIFLLVILRIKIGFEYPDEQQYYLALTNIKYILLIMGTFLIMIGYAFRSIYTEILRMFLDLDTKTKQK